LRRVGLFFFFLPPINRGGIEDLLEQ
jgi:hypothetical protein